MPSLSQPGGSLTGLALPEPEFETKRLEILREAIRPHFAHVAFLVDYEAMPRYAPRAEKALRSACRLTGLRADFLAVNTAQAVQRALDEAIRSRAQAVELIAMTPGASFGGLQRDAARLVAKILRGSKVADLPVERPTRFSLGINLKTAKAIGLTIPASLLGRADQIIE